MGRFPLIVTLTGAYKNVGDHLIGDRGRTLLKHFCQQEIIDITRAQIKESDYETFNKSNAVILLGGPAYQEKIYPNVFPIELEKISKPVIPMGLGGKFRLDETDTSFTQDSERFIKSIHTKINYSSVRDEITLKTLSNYGINNVKMTGCPAWYDLEKLQEDFPINKNPKHIILSTPAKITLKTFELVKYLANKFPNARKTLTMHHGFFPDKGIKGVKRSTTFLAIAAYARMLDYDAVSLEANLPYMKDLYNSCDLHIGYRVHAHLYCLSRRIPSFIINEDSRGVGQAQILKNPILMANDKELINECDNALNNYMKDGSGVIESKDVMLEKFNVMEMFIKENICS
jgi:hypothetical protein